MGIFEILRAWGFGLVTELLPAVHKALGSIPASRTKTNKQQNLCKRMGIYNPSLHEIYNLVQGLINYNPWDKPSTLSVFINYVYIGSCHAHSFTYHLWLLSCQNRVKYMEQRP
jgi:hypothetical protein